MTNINYKTMDAKTLMTKIYSTMKALPQFQASSSSCRIKFY